MQEWQPERDAVRIPVDTGRATTHHFPRSARANEPTGVKWDTQAMINLLLAVGVLQLASAALLGWVIALHRAKPEVLAKGGIKAPHRVMQLHLDQVMMGLIDLAVATAFPDIPDLIAIPIVVGTILNPLGFVPLAFWTKVDETVGYRAAIGVSFIATSGGLVALAVWVLAGR